MYTQTEEREATNWLKERQKLHLSPQYLAHSMLTIYVASNTKGLCPHSRHLLSS